MAPAQLDMPASNIHRVHLLLVLALISVHHLTQEMRKQTTSAMPAIPVSASNCSGSFIAKFQTVSPNFASLKRRKTTAKLPSPLPKSGKCNQTLTHPAHTVKQCRSDHADPREAIIASANAKTISKMKIGMNQ